MIHKRLNLKWFCFSQVNAVNKEILLLMKEAGCYNIGFGIESSDETILKRMGKPLKPERALKVLNTANEIGLKTQAFYIFGTPGETKEQMEKTHKAFIDKFESKLDSLAFSTEGFYEFDQDLVNLKIVHSEAKKDVPLEKEPFWKKIFSRFRKK